MRITVTIILAFLVMVMAGCTTTPENAPENTPENALYQSMLADLEAHPELFDERQAIVLDMLRLDAERLQRTLPIKRNSYTTLISSGIINDSLSYILVIDVPIAARLFGMSQADYLSFLHTGSGRQEQRDAVCSDDLLRPIVVDFQIPVVFAYADQDGNYITAVHVDGCPKY